MMSRSPLLPRRTRLGLFGAALMSLGLATCGPPDGADLEAVPEAKAGCEPATEPLLATNENMLPGRVCTGCHRAGGQALNSPWTVSGTIFKDKNSPCNQGGLAGYVVEILDMNGALQPQGRIKVNGVGNFWSAARFVTPLKVRIYKESAPDKKTEMQTPLGRGSEGNLKVSCNDCHQFPGREGAPGRIYPIE